MNRNGVEKLVVIESEKTEMTASSRIAQVICRMYTASEGGKAISSLKNELGNDVVGPMAAAEMVYVGKEKYSRRCA